MAEENENKKNNENAFYVTTPIYYPNDIPHIGHGYTTIAADVISRWKRLEGYEVFFLTGTDEHGKKIQETAKKKEKSPKEFLDELVPKFKEAWKKLNLNYDKFIRTTDKDHEEVVKEVLQKVYDNGDIYIGEYEGLYCTDCEAFYTEKDLEEGNCPVHKKPPERLKEESYFFRLSKYQDKLLELFESNSEFILPGFRRKEIVNKIKEGLKDLSISRTSFDWGIRLPFDEKHICYVWFDALFNYVSGIGYNEDKEKFNKFWPPEVQLIGKDISWFHYVYWPAFLMSAGFEIPKTIFSHGWWTFNKEKISKSRGKVLNIDELVSIAGVDSARYFLLRSTPFGDDGDFSTEFLINRHNNELANKLGNLVSRVSGLAEKNGIEKTENSLLEKLDIKKIKEQMNNYEFDKVLNEVFSFIDLCNEYVQEKKPWETKDKKVLYEVADSIKAIGILLWPFIPETSEKISEKIGFNLKEKNIEDIYSPLEDSVEIKKGEVLFRKKEVPKQEMKKEEVPDLESFYITSEAKEKGINACVAVIKNVKISNKNSRLEEMKKQTAEKIMENNYEDNSVLEEYRNLYPNEEGFVPAPENLVKTVKNKGRFPNINTAVDAYNIIAADSLLSVGAHDLSKIEGNVGFKIADGSEKFTPLGGEGGGNVKKGEYVFKDDKEVLCRMDIKQSEKTKVTKGAKNLLVYTQGNKKISQEYLREKLKNICDLVTDVCGGEYKFLEEKNE